jgi:hypothetical protein
MKHREIIIAMANDEKVEYWSPEYDQWLPAGVYNPVNYPQFQWRIAPKMMSINGMEFPAPVSRITKALWYVYVQGPTGIHESFHHATEADSRQMYEAIVKACTP